MKMSISGLILMLSASLPLVSCDNSLKENPGDLPESSSPVYISEYLAAKGWIELFNPSSFEVDLDGYVLVVDGEKRNVGARSAAPGTCVLISDIKGLADAADFYLKDADGCLVDWIDLPKSKKRKSVVRLKSGEDGFSEHVEERISPGFPNTPEGREAYRASRRRPNDTGLIFSEILPGCKKAYLDSDGNSADFVELYNPTSVKVDLSGYALSDNEDDPYDFTFPGGTVIQPGGYLLVNCSSDYKKNTADGLCAPFSISNGADSILLFDPDGFIVLEYGPVSAASDCSLVSVDGAPFVETSFISPGLPNTAEGAGEYLRSTGAGILQAVILPPSAIPGSGRYDGVDGITVTLSAQGEIRYTTDGSVPTASSTLYTGPIQLSSTKVIRAVATDGKGHASSVSSFTYLVNEGHTLDVVSMMSNPGGLFSVQNGIYSTGPYRLKPHGAPEEEPGIPYPYTQANYWRKWVRQANVQLLPVDGSAGFSADCGASIFGGFSRINSKKSLKFKFKKAYGDSKLHYSLFANRDFSDYDSFVMRCGGQDVYGALIKDDLVATLCEGLLDVMATRPAIFYINGEYYGIYHIREKVNRHFVASHYNVPTDSIDIIQGNGNPEEGSVRDWKALLSYVRSHDLSRPECFEYVAERMDLRNYADFIIAEICCDNKDAGNIRCFRSPKIDGKWRWILYDVDISMYNPTSDTYHIWLKPTNQNLCQTDLIRGLLKNREFHDIFVERLEYQMHNIWNKANVNAAIDAYVKILSPEVERNNRRWVGSYKTWEDNIARLRKFADGRQSYLRRQFEVNPLVKGILRLTPEELDRCFEIEEPSS